MPLQVPPLPDPRIVEGISRLSAITLDEALEMLLPLLLYVVGISAYSLFVFKFYRTLARADLVRLRRIHYFGGLVGVLERAGHVVFNFVENLVVTPIVVFFWFAFMATILLLLSKHYTPDSVMLVSAAVVGGARVTAYYTEALSQDVAKMIPFALLGVFIVDISYFDWQSSIQMARQLPAFWMMLSYYLAFIVALEAVMRTLRTLYRLLVPSASGG